MIASSNSLITVNLRISAYCYLCLIFYTCLIHFLIHLRFNPVITVYISNISSCSNCKASISSIRQSSIYFVDYLDSLVFLRICITHIGRMICRAIIHKNNFKIRITLFFYRINTSLQILFHVIDRNITDIKSLLFTHLSILIH